MIEILGTATSFKFTRSNPILVEMLVCYQIYTSMEYSRLKHHGLMELFVSVVLNIKRPGSCAGKPDLSRNDDKKKCAVASMEACIFNGGY